MLCPYRLQTSWRRSLNRVGFSAMPESRRIKLGLIQMACSPDPDSNLRKAVERASEAARTGANLICLPELFRSQYFCQREDHAAFDLAESIPGPSTDALAQVA